ncbi:hypothetical protein TCAL_10739 [Tigriopus californicus]|uniref:Saposin B-type domain-containing protein n=1 Tax=Tigriopus californicus TaxID=6832 RepID=A0A553NV83_TIGCA|nr:saposin-C-like [Tigriopus californicus]TRY69339.1 hypothetical protein TCAL_10739 [Tigriopus californicus]|eukprot:TCALIF_10739-PA protein Name:"Similar to PSAPL1 Proactivator polypeptide-like 1 (Homo sapiens)" AED:0.03 eAED:0.03 QI:78/1/0.5/1/1/1/2/0/108
MKVAVVLAFAFVFGSACASNEARFSVETRNGTYCELCKDVVEYFDGVITKPENEEFITEVLKQVCTQFPDQETECEILIEAYYDDFIELIVNLYFLPEEACTDLGLCF